MKKSGKKPAGRAAVPKKGPPPKKVQKKKSTTKAPDRNAGRVLELSKQVSHYRSALGRALYDKRKVEEKVKETQKKALLAISTAATALAAAAQALAESDDSAETPAAAPKEEKKPKAEKPKAEEKPKEEKKPDPPAEKSIMDKVRDACKEYAGINGREALREVLNKYTDKTVADIPADKLPEFLKDLGG